ncbi:DUF4012 domain-containing protein [Bifidobacterium reuteri]|uniref:DUF4012 domain-containing protein n=1 Tax=Bifidobacterium reuteri TaxID=983706 RepID=A0A5J5E347_9BIFI|nr:DUF4012 domain-containing protein [Bifidobacterium reuteri]KAA8823220.1 DUF4012 domain-containing protein [Bifidobacterium reuteri]
MAQLPNAEGNNSEPAETAPLGSGYLGYMAAADQTDGEASGSESNSASGERHHRRRRRMSARHIRKIRRRRRIRRVLIGIGVLVLFLAALTGWFAYSALKVKGEVEQAVAVANGMQQSLADGDTASMTSSMDAFTVHAATAYDQTNSILWNVASRVPYYGDDISAVRTAVTAMENISSQAMPALKQASSALNMSDVAVKDGTIDVSGLTKYGQSMKAADDVIADAKKDLIGAPDPHIQQIADAMQKAKQYLHTLSGTIHNANVAVQVAPKMLGSDGSTRTYLILAQTNSEIRPGGGLPGSWGVMTVSNGKVELQPFVSGGKIPRFTDPVVPLTAEERTLYTDKLGRVAVDTNFTPDFPRTGEISKAMWKAHAGQDVDGVIAIDPVFLQNMLKVSGGVTLPDGVTLDGTNAAQYLLNQVYIDKSEDQQDEYFAAAAGLSFMHIMANAKDGKSFLKAVTTSVGQGHMKVWSAHEDEQKLLLNTPISGALKTEASTPEVGVFFSDLSQAKMDWYLKRSVSVKFDKVAPDGADQYTVHVKLTNMLTQDEVGTLPRYIVGPFLSSLQAGQIDTAMFVYAPAGGRLVDWKSTDGKSYDGVTMHNTLTVGVKKFVLNPGESYEATIHVELAPGVKTPLDVYQTPQVEGRTD